MSSEPCREIPATRQLWQSVVEGNPAATFFHTPVWADILESANSKWRAKPLAVEFENGNIALLPLLRYPILGRMWEYAESMVPGVYGGPIFRDPPTDSQLELVWRAVARLPEVYLAGNPFASYDARRLTNYGFQCRADFTHVLDLSIGFKQVSTGFRKGHRADIKSAQKQGLSVRLADSPADISRYFDIYQDTLRRWGHAASGFYKQHLFEALSSHPRMGHEIKLWLACSGDKIVAGIWVFSHASHVVYWHAATLSDSMALHPSHLLVATAIEHACMEDGARWFDFNPSGGLAGVAAFKQGFGAERLDFVVLRRYTPLGKLYRGLRYFKQRFLHISPL